MADNKTFKDAANATFTGATKEVAGINYARQLPVWDEGGTLRDVSDAKPLPVSMTGGGDASAANQVTANNRIGDLTETAPGTDTASSGVNGRLQRIAQRITSLIALLPSALTGSGNFKAAIAEALPAGTNVIGSVKVTDGTTVATVRELGANDAMNVAIVDGAGNQITSFGGGTQYTEDAAAAPDPVGGALIARRRDTLSTETTTDGDNTALNSTGKGELYVKHVDAVPITDNGGSLTVDNAGTFAVQDSEKVADNAAFTDGTTKVQPAGFVFDEVAGTALTENDAAAARVDSKRAQVLVIEDETTRGRRVTVTAANALKIDGSAVTQPVSAASLPLPAGAATETTLGTRLSESDFDTKVGALTETAPGTDTASSGVNGRLQRIAQRLTSLIALIPSALTGSGNFKAALVEATATLTTKETRSATPAQSSVAGSATNVTLLASNANRLGATIYNDSTAVLYLKLGATASTTSFTQKMQPDGYYEVPFGYTGIIDGLWASATGNARITELTA